MNYTTEIVQLYSDVFDYEKEKFNVNKNNFRVAVNNLNEAYSPNPAWQNDYTSKMTDFNDPALRCAYLHKHAMVHSGLVIEILQTILRQTDIYNHLRYKKELNLCSLGGGPGTEIVSLMFVIQEIFGSVRCNVNVIDYSLEWKQVFETIIGQLRTGRFGRVKDIVSSWYFSYDYHSADLLNASYYGLYKVKTSVKNADIITMIKFMSAAACDKTKSMVRTIFQTMKPGGMLLFVDNAAGGFDKMMQETALECSMMTVFGPMKHYDYENSSFTMKRYGYTSQYKTKVSIQMWKKLPSSYNTTAQLQREFLYGPRRTTVAFPVQEWNSPTIQVSPKVEYTERDVIKTGCCSIS